MANSERTGGSIGRRVLWPAVVVLAGALVLAGCANTGSDDGSGGDATGTASAGESTAARLTAVATATNAAAADLRR